VWADSNSKSGDYSTTAILILPMDHGWIASQESQCLALARSKAKAKVSNYARVKQLTTQAQGFAVS